jgi:tetratricopeptide (TPR) repeat protein
MQDLETALQLDTENVRLAEEMGMVEGRANAHVNLGHDYLALGEPGRAIEHLQQAEQLFQQDVWFRWRHAIRMQVEMTNYWIHQGDLKMATMHAAACLQAAETPRARKYLAWGHKLLGDIAVLEERMDESRREYQAALDMLARNPCPMIEWQILKASAKAARHAKSDSTREELLGRARAVIQSLAESIRDDSYVENSWAQSRSWSFDNFIQDIVQRPGSSRGLCPAGGAGQDHQRVLTVPYPCGKLKFLSE